MYKAFIVDDEPYIRDGLKQIVRWDEHSIEVVGEAGNGAEALEALKRLQPHILVTDIKMPVMDGLTLISRLRDKGSKIKVIVISGFDDFKLVKEALKYGVENYITKPINAQELSSTLWNTVDKMASETMANIRSRENEFVIRDNLLNRLITNHISKRELAEKASILGFRAEDKLYLVAVAKILNRNLERYHDNSTLEFAVMNILAETVSKRYDCSVIQDLSGTLVVLFHSLQLRDEVDGPADSLREAIHNCNIYLDINLFIAVGDVQELESMHQSYETAKDMLQLLVVYPPNTVVIYDKLADQWITRQESYQVELDLLTELIRNQDRGGIARFFDELYKDLDNASFLTYEYFQTLLAGFLSCYINLIKAHQLDVNQERLFARLWKLKEFDKIIAAIRKIALELTDIIRPEQEGSRPRSLIEEIIAYCGEHYNESGLSLKALSFRFGLSAPYLGQMFKNKTGELFSDYLNNIRIEKAKELLKTSYMKANEISEKVGYTDPNYFYRVFKKITGCYPSEFRQ